MAKKVQIDPKLLDARATALFRTLDALSSGFTNGANAAEDFKAMMLSLRAINDFLESFVPAAGQLSPPLANLEEDLEDLSKGRAPQRLKFPAQRYNLGDPVEIRASWVFAAVLVALKDEENPGNHLGKCKQVAKIFTSRKLALPGRKKDTAAKGLQIFCKVRLGDDAEMKKMYDQLLADAHANVPAGTTAAKRFEAVLLAHLESDNPGSP